MRKLKATLFTVVIIGGVAVLGMHPPVALAVLGVLCTASVWAIVYESL